MRNSLYPKLAWQGIRKNGKMYTPYILTCIGMVMMFYIVDFLVYSPVLGSMRGGNTMQDILSMGTFVIGVFSLIFLFYTNSFLVRRRKKEFGLYNILGMGKWNLARILLYETLIIAGISLVSGLFAGIVFSKFAELGMINILRAEVSFSLTLEGKAVGQTVILFAVIFALILLNTLRQIHLSNPIELLRGGNTGEKPPKANWFLALAGAVILGGAYHLAVTIENPVDALIWFFVAVVMVIVATYLLFIAGSVVFCRMLQKNKKYYYKTNHFISVSSMVYRMKRNGAGLASICILCTMVLVMISMTVCLYIGTEDSLRKRYPRNINLDTTLGSPADFESSEFEKIRQMTLDTAEMQGLTADNVLDYRVVETSGYIGDEGMISLDRVGEDVYQSSNYTELWQIFIVPLEDYNRLMGTEEVLDSDEVLVYATKSAFENNTVGFTNTGMMKKIKEVVPTFIDNGVDSMQVMPSLYIFVPDYSDFLSTFNGLYNSDASGVVGCHWLYGFDMDGNEEAQTEMENRLVPQVESYLSENSVREGNGIWHIVIEGVAVERVGYYGLYGGLFFLGVLLGIVFIFAAVLIIYYKQVSEGYEDQSRFEIMQKVGMTKKDIKKSINSQVLTVFFMPLLTAGVHLAFAFPLIYKILIVFGLTQLKLLILVTLSCYLIFALFYVVVYRITSKAYYSIVSGRK